MSSRKYKQYPAEFRESSARLALESDQPMSQTARELGISAKRLYCWVNAYSGSNEKLRPAKDSASEEIKSLKKELSRVKLERDILKKAAAYFAREVL
jgi:transposase|tara:strand:+ start:65 stop:355 length:291 start_codon:yes stop_codon:yes gene_type:complete